jgi:hypothetical protein
MTEVFLYSSVSSDNHTSTDVIPAAPSQAQLNTSGASANAVFQWSVNISVNVSDGSAEDVTDFNNWWALLALVLVLGTAAGNILVCLAITWERRLQNVTNYFLMSLAITDLMVAVLVMPLGILTLVRGKLALVLARSKEMESQKRSTMACMMLRNENLSVQKYCMTILL